MTTNNNNNNQYWQPFTANIVDESNLLTQPQSTQQQTWNNADFDMDSNANKLFQLNEYQNNHDLSEGDSPESGSSNKRPEDVSMGEQKQRRKEQNRAAQRAFRERKEKYVKELEQKIKEMESKHYSEMSRITQENESLKQLVKKMEIEIYTLKGAAMAFNVSIQKLRDAGIDANTEDISFAERELNRFDHHQHPLMNSGVKMIPCSQIWERLSQHPNVDEFDLDKLCEELKGKAVCSGHGPVIPESELNLVLQKMDTKSF